MVKIMLNFKHLFVNVIFGNLFECQNHNKNKQFFLTINSSVLDLWLGFSGIIHQKQI